MWWLVRLGFIVGGSFLAGEVLSGCSRRRDDRPLVDHSTSAPPVPPSLTPPQLPSLGSATEPGAVPSANPSNATSLIDCSRFRSPVFTVDVSNPQRELRLFRESVLPVLNRYTPELSQNNFSGVFQDRELNAALLTLQGASVYLREGNQYALDTESDLMNLYSAVDWLQTLEGVSINPSQTDVVSTSIRNAWVDNHLTVNFKGFYFQDYRAPHRDSRTAQNPSADSQTQAYNRFRIVNPMNARDYPDFQVCGIPERVLYSWTIRPNSTP